MKTPRQLLLERHQSDEERLNAVSQSLVERLSRNHGGAGEWRIQPPGHQPGAGRPFQSRAAKAVWRWYWGGMAAAWLFIVALNLGSLGISLSTPDEPVATARDITPESRELLQQQWAWRQELISPVEAANESPQPKSPGPGPRSALPGRSGTYRNQA